MTRGQAGDLWWHVHHDTLAEALTEPIKKRIDYINARKPEGERATRLRWMEPVLTLDGPAVADLYLARAALDRAWADYDRAHTEAEHDRAWADIDRAEAARYRALADIEPLHAIEHPGCPWDGRTLVFPEVTP